MAAPQGMASVACHACPLGAWHTCEYGVEGCRDGGLWGRMGVGMGGYV